MARSRPVRAALYGAPMPRDLPSIDRDARPSGQIRGGDAWVVPYEPGGAVWVTATAPAIRVMDLRDRSAAPVVEPVVIAAR